MTEIIQPPAFEFANLLIVPGHPLLSSAKSCIRMYWKQATRLSHDECVRYLKLLGPSNIEHLLTKPKAGVTSHFLYPAIGNGQFVPEHITWLDYMLLSALYGKLPKEYLAAIKARYGHTTIADYTHEYRRIYPAQPGELQRSSDAATQTTVTLSSAAQSAALDTWHIDDVVSMLSLPSSKKRPNSTPESIAKRVKMDDDEILEHIHLESEMLQEAIQSLQDDQETTLREVRQAVEENRQALGVMQSESRQFMSAVAATLRDIQGHLGE
ncbi:hypothetical protein J3F83DRAFT_756832 [Trichoderma novae-zelandiae]